jgi:hypothetical protein
MALSIPSAGPSPLPVGRPCWARLGAERDEKVTWCEAFHNAIKCGSAAGTLRQSVKEHLAVKEVSAAWSITEPLAAPDLSVHVW